MLLTLSALSGILHATGYALYLRSLLRSEITPNALSWLMFAYGTGMVAVLEAACGARLTELLLPTVCAIASIVVASRLWRGSIKLRVIPMADRVAFAIDVILSISYVGLFFAERTNLVTGKAASSGSTVLLVCALATNVTAFLPIIRSTYEEPSSERPEAWFVWSGAYLALLVLTALEGGSVTLLLYPALNVLIHLLVASLSLRVPRYRTTR